MYATTTDELNLVFRSDVTDPLEGVSDTEPDSECLWKNADVYRYMTAAFDALLRDTGVQYKVLNLTVMADSPYVTLPMSVLEIRSAYLTVAKRELEPLNLNDRSGVLRRDYGLVRPFGSPVYDDSTGTPFSYVRDYARKQLRLSPIPVADDVLEIQCTATISIPMMEGMLLPVREVPDLNLALMYMKYMAYAKQDADTLDLVRSSDFKAQFDEGAKVRKGKLLNQRRTPGVIRPQW